MNVIPILDCPKIYAIKKEYIFNKNYFIEHNSFESRRQTVEGMSNVEYRFKMLKKHVPTKQSPCYWGMNLIVDSGVAVECEASFEMASERDSFYVNVAKSPDVGTQYIGKDNFILHARLLGKKCKLFYDGITKITVKATFCFTTKENQNLYGITKMIQSRGWPQRLQSYGGDKKFKFIVGDEFIHQFFLTLESTVFNAMLENTSFKETQTGEMTITNFKFETIKAVVAFCYGEDIAEFMESTENAVELLKFADMYDMDNLKTSFEEYYSKKLTKFNVADILAAAHKFNASDLENKCISYIHSLPLTERYSINYELLDKELSELVI